MDRSKELLARFDLLLLIALDDLWLKLINCLILERLFICLEEDFEVDFSFDFASIQVTFSLGVFKIPFEILT